MADLLNLTRIFNNSLFRIPDYQRGYAWGARQFADFWGDLQRVSSERVHYCGQLTVERVEKDWELWKGDEWLVREAGYSPFYIVDGQQRITTAVVFLQCLLEGLNDDHPIGGLNAQKQRQKFLVESVGLVRSCLFGYAHDNPSHEFFRTQILGVPSNDYNGTRTVYTENLARVRDYFKEKVSKMVGEDRDNYFRAITQRFQFNVYELSNDMDVFVAFETMNNRGKPLTRLELLKNRLIYLSTLANRPPKEQIRVRSNINAVWKTIYEELGKQPGFPLDDDEFLRAHWIIYFGYDKDEADPLTSFLLDKHFTAERVSSGELELTHVQSYIDSLQKCVRWWQQMHFPEEHRSELGDGLAQALARLDRLDFGSMKPLLLSVLSSNCKPEIKLETTKETERFLLIVRSLGGSRSDTGIAAFYRRAHEVFEISAMADTVPVLLAEQVTRNFSVAAFKNRIDSLFEDDDGQGFYELKVIDFILFEYDESLRLAAKAARPKIIWKDFKGHKNSIEHVYPQAAEDVDWPSFTKFSAKQKQYLLHSLGNLVAVSVAKNSSLSKSKFSVKCAGKDGSPGFSEGSFSELRIAKNTDWTEKQILERGIELLQYIEGRWQVPLGAAETFPELLKLDFLIKKNEDAAGG